MKASIKYILIAMVTFIMATELQAGNNPDSIVGKWIAFPKQNLIVEIFRAGKEYKGKVAWFNDNDDPSKPMRIRTDENNPDPALRNRKLLGLEVLKNMTYNAETNRWESGEIYDAKSGKTWRCSAVISKNGTLQVRGFWHFEFIGRNISFIKAAP